MGSMAMSVMHDAVAVPTRVLRNSATLPLMCADGHYPGLAPG